MCREIYFPSDYPGPDGEPLAEVVDHHPLMSGRSNADFYPGLVEPGDVVMRKTGFSRSPPGTCSRSSRSTVGTPWSWAV